MLCLEREAARVQVSMRRSGASKLVRSASRSKYQAIEFPPANFKIEAQPDLLGGSLRMKPTLLFFAAAAIFAVPAIPQDLPVSGPLSGECFARVIVPAQFSSAEQIMIPRQDGTFEARTRLNARSRTSRRRPNGVRVLCEADAGPTVVRAIQQALQQEGYYDGPIDGSFGQRDL